MQIRPVFWAIEEAILRICFSKVNLSSIVTPRNLSELETSRSSSDKVNGRWYLWGALDRLIIIDCVLRELSLIPHFEHHD